ncbi:MAG TPA: tetratricopeptide repeat protein [Candidatus Obscuribacterales bacterium]
MNGIRAPSFPNRRMVRQEYMRTLGELGQLCLNQRKLEDDEKYLRRAFDLHNANGAQEERGMDFQSYDFIRVLAALADLELAKSNYPYAEKMYRQAIQLIDRLPGNADVRRRLNENLSKLLQRTDRRQEARALIDAVVVSASEKRWRQFFNEGREAYRKKNYPESELIYAHALDEAEHMERGGPELALTLRAMAQVYLTQGKFEQARLACQRALGLMEDGGAVEDDEIDRTLRTLVRALMKRDRFAEVEPLLVRQLSIQEKIYGDKTHFTGETLALLAYTEHRLGHEKKAEPLLAKAEYIATRFPRRPRTIIAQMYIGRIYAERGELLRAEQNLRRAAEMRRQREGRSAEPFLELGNFYAANGQREKGIAAYEEGLSYTGRDSVDATTFELLVKCAAARQENKEDAEAETLYAAAFCQSLRNCLAPIKNSA